MKPAILAVFLAASALSAQDQHVTWKLTVEPPTARSGDRVLVRMAGHVEDGWHLYSMSTPGAMPTKLQLTGPAVESARPLQAAPALAFDPNFNAETETYEGDVAFLLDVQLKKDATAGPTELAINARYQTCNPKMCVPSKWNGAATVTIDPSAPASTVTIPAGYSEPKAPPPPGATPATTPTTSATAEGLAGFLAIAFGFGLASIF